MSHFQQHREFFNRPIMLTVEEQQDPVSVIDDFFTDYNLCEIRKMNEETDHVCLTTEEHPFGEATARDCLIAYRRAEERVMEVIWVIWKQSTRTPAPDSEDDARVPKALKNAEMDSLVKGLSEIQADLANLVEIVITSPSKPMPILPPLEPSRMAKDQEQLPLDIEHVRMKVLNFQSRLAQLYTEALKLWPVN